MDTCDNFAIQGETSMRKVVDEEESVGKAELEDKVEKVGMLECLVEVEKMG